MRQTRTALLALALVLGACASGTRPAETETTTSSTLVSHQAESHAPTNGTHFGAYFWAGVKQSDGRLVYVFDRTSTTAQHNALVAYIAAHNNLWTTYGGIPYFVYADDRANYTGQCNAGSGSYPGYSLVLVCTGEPTGNFGVAFWSTGANDHIAGESNVWLRASATEGRAFSGFCHEFMHLILGQPVHSTETSSCFYNPLQGDNLGYTAHDVATIVNRYYSHPLGGSS